jgi:hypothetical protein
MTHARLATVALLAFALSIVFGCGSAEELPETASVRGSVTLRGQPLLGGTITFQPQQIEQGNPGYADVQPDGTYRVTTYRANDGAVLGPHTVTVEVFPGQRGGPESGLPGSESKLPSPIPARYRDPAKSPLKFEVKPGDNSFPIELVD